MYGLLYKEFILNRKILLGTAAAALIFTVVLFILSEEKVDDLSEIFIMINMFITIIIFLVVGMLQQGLFESDERKLWQFYITSTPDGVKNQIRAKYVFSFLLSMVTVLYCILVNLIFGAVNNIAVSVPITIIFLTQLLFRSIEFPFLVRFGSKYGNTFRSVIITVIVFAGMVYFLFGDLSIFGSYEDFTNFLMNHIFSQNGFTTGFTDILYLLPALIYILYYLSYKISCKLYLKGGENYDR
ncbi:MAG: ABC-2 transporter permease [Clostridia bacterium]|nr:ABC-2 transporter permease [Clostridia bacterium]